MDIYYFFVILGWVIFRSDTIGDAIIYIKSMFGLNCNLLVDSRFIGYLEQNIILIIIGIILCTPIFKMIKEKINSNIMLDIISILTLIGLFVLSVSSLVSNSYNPFIYFNF